MTKDKIDCNGSKVLICGAYGAGNIGDEAMLEAIIRQLRSVDAHVQICVVTRQPEETKKLYGINAVHTFDFPAIYREMKKTDVYINGGGSLIQDITSRRSLWYYLNTIKTAKKCGCKVVMYGCGIGPIVNKADEKLASLVIDRYADTITLREPASRGELERLGVTKPKIVLACDPVLSLAVPNGEYTARVCADMGLEAGRHYVGVSLRRWNEGDNRTQAVAQAIRSLYDTHGLIPVFLTAINPKDEAEIKAVIEHIPEIPYKTVSGSVEAKDLIALISRMELVISMRLHGLIFSACSATPMVGINYDPKVEAFTQYSGLGTSVGLEDLTSEKLVAACEKALSMGDTSSARAALMAKKEENLEVLRELLK